MNFQMFWWIERIFVILFIDWNAIKEKFQFYCQLRSKGYQISNVFRILWIKQNREQKWEKHLYPISILNELNDISFMKAIQSLTQTIEFTAEQSTGCANSFIRNWQTDRPDLYFRNQMNIFGSVRYMAFACCWLT